MSVTTEITGEPAAIEAAADWLRQSLAPELANAADAANGARRDADASWRSTAGEEFASTMGRARDEVDNLAGAARRMADDLDAFAAKLRSAQEQMADVRSTASAAGLVVSGWIVEPPGTGPAFPSPTVDATPEAMAAYDDQLRAYEAHQQLVRAYAAAEAEAARIDRYYATACRELQDDYTPSTHASWIVTLSSTLGDTAAAAVGVHVALNRSRLTGAAQALADEAARAVADMQANPERYLKRKWFFFKTLDEARLEADKLAIEGKLDESQRLLQEADELTESRSLRYLGRAGKVLGPVGIGLGAYNDWHAGETVPQIAVSQGVSAGLGAAAGFGASVGTAALIGAAAGSVVPGVGTAVGAVVGTVVGAGVAIFADGAIDSVFENGPDVGKAWDEGLDALADTGEAISDGLSDVGRTIGGWFR